MAHMVYGAWSLVNGTSIIADISAHTMVRGISGLLDAPSPLGWALSGLPVVRGRGGSTCLSRLHDTSLISCTFVCLSHKFLTLQSKSSRSFIKAFSGLKMGLRVNLRLDSKREHSKTRNCWVETRLHRPRLTIRKSPHSNDSDNRVKPPWSDYSFSALPQDWECEREQ